MPDSSHNRKRRKFSEEFKRDAAALVLDTGRPIAEVAREFGAYDSSFGNWVRQERRRRGETTDEPTADQLARPLEARQPMGRLVTPAEVAEAIVVLASPGAGAATGTSVLVDGGPVNLRLRAPGD